MKSSMFVRQAGMGGAATAVCDDMSAVFYNPAGLARVRMTGMTAGTIDTNKDLYDMNHYYSYGMGAIGYLGYQKILPTEEKAIVDMFAVGRQSVMGISYGITYKNILFDSPANLDRGYSADVGLLLNVSPQFSIGLLGQDLVSEKSLEITSSTRLGMAYRPFDERLIIAADTEIGRIPMSDYTHYGIEYALVEGFKLRAGIDKGYTTFGATLNLPFMAVHYAAMLTREVPGGTMHMVGGEIVLGEQAVRPVSVIRPKTYAQIDIGGSLIGGVGDFSLFGGGRVGADSIIANIKDASDDPYVDGIILKVRGFDGGLGSFGIVQEIRSELLKAKDKGKKIVAYMEEGTLGDEYYLASAADRVVVPPSGTVGGIGKSVSIYRIKGLLEKFGIEVQLLAKGKYKTTFNSYSDELTPEQKVMLQGVVADLYRQMVSDISTSRKGKISIEKLKEIADGGVYSPRKAKDLGLIDEVGYFREAQKQGGDLYGTKDDIKIVERKDLLTDIDQNFLMVFPNKIAVVDIDGDIVTGQSGQNVLFGGHATGADSVCDKIKKAVDDWQVKAIIVRVNSGGGSAVASGQIYTELKRAREKGKIVVASMGDVAASGGYYISAAANKIVADPGTITGSIGVVENDVLVYSGLLKKLDVKAETVKEGKHSDMFSGLRKLSTEEVKLLSGYLEDTYQDFIASVASGRGMTTQEVASLAEGRIYTGQQALDKKLIDKTGNFTDAVDLAADLSGINGEPVLVYYREDNFFLNFGQNTVKMLGLGGGLFPSRSGGLAEFRLSM